MKGSEKDTYRESVSHSMDTGSCTNVKENKQEIQSYSHWLSRHKWLTSVQIMINFHLISHVWISKWYQILAAEPPPVVWSSVKLPQWRRFMPSINASQGQTLIAPLILEVIWNQTLSRIHVKYNYRQRPAHDSGVTMPDMASAQFWKISSIISHTDPRSAHGTVD